MAGEKLVSHRPRSPVPTCPITIDLQDQAEIARAENDRLRRAGVRFGCILRMRDMA
ncbi:hypothetical protein X759_36000 [Mesorhizobium sp. LSHC420B00]|nr:hypothetical protein X759_36000 [Mesorhizobium sp. LSHC420B00]